MVLGGLSCRGRERDAPASPNKLASKYLYERSTLKKKVSWVITLHHRVRDGIPERDGFKTTFFFFFFSCISALFPRHAICFGAHS